MNGGAASQPLVASPLVSWVRDQLMVVSLVASAILVAFHLSAYSFHIAGKDEQLTMSFSVMVNIEIHYKLNRISYRIS